MLPGQLSLWDVIRDLRDAGMARAEQAQGPEWAQLAYAAIERVARKNIHVHIDQVLSEDVPEPHSPNSWGAVWMRAIRNGIIQRTNQVRPCTVGAGQEAAVSRCSAGESDRGVD